MLGRVACIVTLYWDPRHHSAHAASKNFSVIFSLCHMQKIHAMFVLCER